MRLLTINTLNPDDTETWRATITESELATILDAIAQMADNHEPGDEHRTTLDTLWAELTEALAG